MAILSANKSYVLALVYLDFSMSFPVLFGHSLRLCLTIISMESKGSSTPYGSTSISVASVGFGTFSCRLVTTRLIRTFELSLRLTNFECSLKL
jgi:hypothetical protein